MIVVCGLKGNGRLTCEVRKSVILHHTPETRILRNLGLQLAELTLTGLTSKAALIRKKLSKCVTLQVILMENRG